MTAIESVVDAKLLFMHNLLTTGASAALNKRQMDDRDRRNNALKLTEWMDAYNYFDTARRPLNVHGT